MNQNETKTELVWGWWLSDPKFIKYLNKEKREPFKNNIDQLSLFEQIDKNKAKK